MFWLFSEIWFWCALATLLGTVFGWWLRGARAAAERVSLEADLASSRRAADDAAAARTRLEGELSTANGRLTPLSGERDTLKTDVGRLQAELDASKSGHAGLSSELERARASLAAAGSAKFDTKPFDSEIARLKSELDACRAQHAAKDAELAKFRAANVVSNEKLPLFLDRPRGVPDDLKLIKGVGDKLNTLLTSLGIFHFRQVANWTDAEVAEVDAKMENFKGRIVRDEWIPQSKLLAEGKHDEFERIYGKMGENN
jgi:predicted flap endonuclease-1-like 5' DNA nuclease